jgi:hypothetical protein
MKSLSYSWVLLGGLLAILAQVVTFYVRFGVLNPQGSFANYVAFFLSGALGGWILIYFLNRQGSSRARWIVLIAFLVVTPVALNMMLLGGLLGPLGVLIAPQLPWALVTWFGSLGARFITRGSNVVSPGSSSSRKSH